MVCSVEEMSGATLAIITVLQFPMKLILICIYTFISSVSHMRGRGGGAGVGVGRRCMLVHKRLYTATGIVCLYVFMCDNVL